MNGISSARLHALEALTGDALCDICDRDANSGIIERTAFGPMRYCSRCYIDLKGQDAFDSAIAHNGRWAVHGL